MIQSTTTGLRHIIGSSIEVMSVGFADVGLLIRFL